MSVCLGQNAQGSWDSQRDDAELTVLYAEEMFSLTTLLFTKTCNFGWAALGVICAESIEYLWLSIYKPV